MTGLLTSVRDWPRRFIEPTGPLPRPSGRGYLFDALLMLAILIVSLRYLESRMPVRHVNGESLPFAPEDWIGPVAFVVISFTALCWRRRYPLTVLWIVMVTAVAIPNDLASLAFALCVVGGYSAAAYSPYRWPAVASLLVAVILFATRSSDVTQDVPMPVDVPKQVRQPGEELVPEEYLPFLVLIPIVVAASAIRTWKFRVTESRTKLAVLEQRQAEELRRAAEAERSRIARELHDVVTHNVSVMVIQTGAARKVMDTDPGQAKQALLSAEAGGRTAMSELRHVMGLLAADTDAADDLTPQPGLDQLDTLVTRIRDAGTPATLSITGRPRPLPSGIELTGYRVVQEALTNTVKHAAGSSATVLIDYGEDRLRVAVTNTDGSSSAAAATGNGRGQLGLRERLAVYGGTLRTGPRPLGGYRVEAVIPLADSAGEPAPAKPETPPSPTAEEPC
ncbi:MAG: sensor histidine kinase [Stackebrandtia sp.]